MGPEKPEGKTQPQESCVTMYRIPLKGQSFFTSGFFHQTTYIFWPP